MKNFLRYLHFWIAIPFGLIIVVTCFTGALLVFETDIYELKHCDMVFVEPQEEALPLSQMLPNVVAALPEDVSVTGVTISKDPGRAYKVNLSKPKHAAIYLNQYTGGMLGEYHKEPFFRTVFFLHRWLMDKPVKDGDGIFWGRIIVGTSTLFFVAALITGVVIWVPRRKRNIPKALRIKSGKLFWHTLHTTGGMYAVLLLLALALTGLTWSFKWYNKGFYKLFGGELATSAHKSYHRSQEAPYLAYDNVLAQLDHHKYKELRITPGIAYLTLGGWGNQLANDQCHFDASTGALTHYIPYADQEINGKIRGWIRSIHFSTWGGYLSKVLSFVVALFGASLPLTGYYMWWQRVHKKKGGSKRNKQE